jgi:hypothetical protein
MTDTKPKNDQAIIIAFILILLLIGAGIFLLAKKQSQSTTITPTTQQTTQAITENPTVATQIQPTSGPVSETELDTKLKSLDADVSGISATDDPIDVITE